jgi:hypothetical protein
VRLALLGVFAFCFIAAFGAAADEPERTIDMSRAFDSGVRVERTQLSPIAPDPPPLSERLQWLLDLRWDRGDVWLLGTRRADARAARETPRAMGRFALELYEGPALIERLRFDFPLLGGPDLEDGGDHASFPSQKLRTRIGVLFPATARGTRLELWDRGTGIRWSLPWPPLEVLNAARAGRDAGAAKPSEDASGSDL